MALLGVERNLDFATCGHPNASTQSTVYAGGKAITLVGDTAGGEIEGPGSSTVYVEGTKISLKGDAIADHGDSPHNAATTDNPSDTVFADGGEE